MLNGYNQLLDEGAVVGDVGNGGTLAAGLPDPTPITVTAETGSTDETVPDVAEPSIPNPFELGDLDTPSSIPETLLDKSVQEKLSASPEGREVLESYSTLQQYKELGMSSIPAPADVKTAFDKAGFYDALDADLATGDADAVLRGLTTESKDGQYYITPDGAKLISTLPNFLMKLPDAEYTQVTTPIIDQAATYLGEQAKTLYDKAMQFRDGRGQFTPQGLELAREANAYALAMQALEKNLYGVEGVTKGEDILAGKRAKDSFSNNPAQLALQRRQLELDKREQELKQQPVKAISATINSEVNKNFTEDIMAISKPLAEMFPNLSPKGIEDLARIFHKDVTEKVLSDNRFAAFRSLVKQAQEGGDPEVIKKAISAHRGLTRRIAHEMWPKWVSEKTTAKVAQQQLKKQAGKSAGAQGSGGQGATVGQVPPFRARNGNESFSEYQHAKQDHVWKHTVGKSGVLVN